MITKTQMISLLGRPLTKIEDDNFNLYLQIAMSRLYSMLNITDSDSDTRTYKSRSGYSEVKTDPFTLISSVKINGVLTTDYLIKQGDNYSADWFNIIEFPERLENGTIEVEAQWGFGLCPTDLQYLVSKLFNLARETGTSRQIKSKSIEDVSITYDNSVSPLDSLKSEYADIIAKYSSQTNYVLSGEAGLTAWEVR